MTPTSTNPTADTPTFGPFGLPMPQGETQPIPATFDEVAPVVVAFVRTYLTGPQAAWYRRKGASGELLVHGNGCSAGGAPFNTGWMDLVSAPVLPLDETVGDLSKPSPREPGEYVRLKGCPADFPADLKKSLQLVIEHDRMVIAQMSEEIRTYLAIQKSLPRSERDPIEKQNPFIAKLMGMGDMDTCLGWRQEWLGVELAPRPKAPRR